MTGTFLNLHSPLLIFCFYIGCLSKDATGALFFVDPCEFLLSHSVSVQRRDGSLFFFLHCSTKVHFYLFALIYLVIVAYFQDFFSQSFHSVSVQRRGRCSISCSDLARPLLFSAAFFWFHSVSVQRRDRCSVSYFDLSLDPFCFPLLSSVFTVCLSKDVTGALLPTPLTP